MGKIKTFLRHAFGLRTLAPISVSALSGYMGLSNMQLLMDDPIAVATVGVFLASGMITWAIVGYDGYKAEQRDNIIQDVSSKLDALLERQVPEPVNIPPSLQNLTNLSSDQIRQAVALLVTRMRQFGANVKERNSTTMLSRNRANLSNEEAKRDFDAMTERLLRDHNAQNSEFNAAYRPEALAYRDEMRRRLRIINSKTHDSVALDYGMLAGTDPVEEAAASLEDLARQLF